MKDQEIKFLRKLNSPFWKKTIQKTGLACQNAKSQPTSLY